MSASKGWRVWRAFENAQVPERDNTALWVALSKACRDAHGRVDNEEFVRWVEVFVEYPRGQA